MPVISAHSMMAEARTLAMSPGPWRNGIRGAAAVAVMVLATACSDSLGVTSYGAGAKEASSQGTAVKDLALREHSEPRPAPPLSPEATWEVPALTSQVGTSADDGGYHYYESPGGAR